MTTHITKTWFDGEKIVSQEIPEADVYKPSMKEEWLFPHAVVPVDTDTTAALVTEIKRLIDIVGGMALAQPAQEPMHPEIKKMYEDFFDKCFRESSPVQEPDAWREFDGEGGYYYRSYEHNEDYASKWDANNPNHKGWVQPLYITPSQRPWVELTEDEIYTLAAGGHAVATVKVVNSILKGKNT